MTNLRLKASLVEGKIFNDLFRFRPDSLLFPHQKLHSCKGDGKIVSMLFFFFFFSFSILVENLTEKILTCYNGQQQTPLE